MIVGNPIIMILKAILNWFRLRRDYIANAVDKIPPEIKDALVAWYSPCKQKLTNYDVIESYAENFTKFMNYTNRGKAVVIPNKIIITESETNNLNIVENFNKTTNDITIKVTGVSQEVQLFVQDFNSYRQYISKDGIYRFTDNNYKYFGFGINKITTGVNVVIEQLPTSILKDFSGNGNHAYLYGGKGKLNSGMGVYNEDFTTYTVQFDNNKPYEQYYNKVIIHNSDNYISNFWKNINEPPLGQTEYSGFKLKISGLPKNSKVNIRVYYGDDYSQIKTIEAITDEIVVIPKTTANVITANKTFTYIDFNLSRYKNTITIEQIPDYPDQLCYDGKMYAVAYNMPILTDYTIIADRTWFDKTNQGVFMSKAVPGNDSAFIFEHIQNAIQSVWNYGLQNIMPIKNDGIVYCNKISYNGDKINIGQAVDSDTLHIGRTRETSDIYFIGCHGDILLFNRTLTDDELDLVKEHFFGIESNIKDALMTTDKKYLALTNNNYIKLNK